MNSKKLLTAVMATFIAGSAQLSQARPGGPGFGHGPGHGPVGPGRPGPGRPDFDDREDRFAVRSAFDQLGYASGDLYRGNLMRGMRGMQDALQTLRGVRNREVAEARNRLQLSIQRLAGALRDGDRRMQEFERNNAIRVIDSAKRDLWNSGLMGRR
ncbi:MAG TPA: hypothetical protein VM901_08035 [Bdellovibrionota bacterium]|jgi:hypothetical protein|nr:hypothetical protein [Bdellovibrionota bacterium]